MAGFEQQVEKKTDLDEKDQGADVMAELASLPRQLGMDIHTRGLCLRDVEAADLHALHRMRMDPEVMRYMTEVETEPVAEKCEKSLDMMRLLMKEGLMSFTVDRRPPDDEDEAYPDTLGFVGITSPPQVTFLFDRAAWGNGYASEALEVFLDYYWYAFPRGLPLRKTVPQSYTESEESEFSWDSEDNEEGGRAGNVLEAHVHEGNLAAERVLRKCRFAVARKEFASAHGRIDVPVTVFRLRGRKRSDRPWNPISQEQRWNRMASCNVDGEVVWK
ncbi:acetyltransferase [Colletotrichum tofieldiae]|uniref:Acetyltransferase n=1 Tax=Colletotrichum tofieldiae TaxID=708197 RepID=A0A166Z0M7_9PEZI|nr:acetyltransferase [Colletotrichum tofieldiae]